MNTTIESLQALYVKNGGNLTDTYSDICGGAAVGNYTTIPDCVAACAKLTLGGGGGAKKFVVELEEDKGEWNTKTSIAEIVAANAANQVVVCKVIYEGDSLPPYEIPLSVAIDNAVMFGGVMVQEKATSIFAIGVLDGNATEWNVETVEFGSTTEPLIVTLTADQSTGDLVANKTYKEVYDAFDDGQTVTFKSEFSGFTVAANMLSCGFANNEYSVAFAFGGSIVEAEGAETDNVSFHVS